jgi:hypothetical protein
MTDFTPYSALVGGIIIGLSVVFYFFTTGRLAGISGIFENAITNSVNRFSNLFFLLGFTLVHQIIEVHEKLIFKFEEKMIFCVIESLFMSKYTFDI